jgi:TRAP-type C4-dicarboxylate transport system permease large subunit
MLSVALEHVPFHSVRVSFENEVTVHICGASVVTCSVSGSSIASSAASAAAAMRPTVRTSIKQANDLGTNFRAIDSYFHPLIPPDIFAAILNKPYIPPKPD